MKELLGNLRAKLEEKKELTQKRKELRVKLEGHRDSESAEYLNMRSEYYGYDDQMERLDEEISELRSEIADKKIEEGLRRKPTPENANVNEREGILASSEYRDAFFRSITTRGISEQDAEVLAFGRRAITNVNGGAVAEGGEYLIPTTTYNMIVSVIKEYGQVYSAVSKTSFAGDIAIPIGRLKGKTEKEDGTFSLEFAFTEVKISQQAIVGTMAVKNLLLKNSISALEAYLVSELGKQIALMLDNGVINGDGGTFKGILQDLTPKTYSTINWDTIVDIEHSLAKTYSKDSGWIMNWATFGKFRKLKGLDNMPLTATTPIILGNGYSVPHSIDNKPVLIVDEVILGDGDVLYGNLASYRVNESQSVIVESNIAENFSRDETTYRGKVYSGGQPVLTSENFAFYTHDSDKATAPIFTPDGGDFSDTVSVTISGENGASVHYTTNGTDPTGKSKKYTEPLTLTATTTVKAVSVKVGKANSDIVEKTFTKA